MIKKLIINSLQLILAIFAAYGLIMLLIWAFPTRNYSTLQSVGFIFLAVMTYLNVSYFYKIRKENKILYILNIFILIVSTIASFRVLWSDEGIYYSSFYAAFIGAVMLSMIMYAYVFKNTIEGPLNRLKANSKYLCLYYALTLYLPVDIIFYGLTILTLNIIEHGISPQLAYIIHQFQMVGDLFPNIYMHPYKKGATLNNNLVDTFFRLGQFLYFYMIIFYVLKFKHRVK